MKRLFLLLTILVVSNGYAAPRIQVKDSLNTDHGGLIDSLKLELGRIEKSYRLLRERTDSTKELSEVDKMELDKLSDALQRISTEIRSNSGNADELADDATNVYDFQYTVVKEGDYTLAADKGVDGDVKVLNGDARIYGSLNGNILVVNGDAYIKSGARVLGNVVVVNGRAHVSDDATVRGSVIEREGSDLKERRSFTRHMNLIEHPDVWQDRDFMFEHVAANYNRVDGLFLGLGQDKEYYWGGADDFSPYGFLGYAFSLHKWRYQLGMDKWFGNEDRFEIGAEGHSLTDSKELWMVGPKENFVYSILAREDYMDYYTRYGMSVHAAQYYDMASRLTLSYDVDKYTSLSRNTNWSIFGGHKVFRDNPAIEDGWMRSVVVSLDHRSYTGGTTRRVGWMADLRGEATLNGVFDFRMLTANVVRYQHLFSGLQMNLRFVGGTSNGDLPPQRVYEIGGFNTLNAFAYKEFSGNRLLLLNCEFLFDPDMFSRSHFFPLNTFTLILLADVGQVQTAPASDAFSGGWGLINSRDFKSDFGVGFGSDDGTFRIFLAWRTDIATSPTLGVRVSRPF